MACFRWHWVARNEGNEGRALVAWFGLVGERESRGVPLWRCHAEGRGEGHGAAHQLGSPGGITDSGAAALGRVLATPKIMRVGRER
jgi:hypothetical protein